MGIINGQQNVCVGGNDMPREVDKDQNMENLGDHINTTDLGAPGWFS